MYRWLRVGVVLATQACVDLTPPPEIGVNPLPRSPGRGASDADQPDGDSAPPGGLPPPGDPDAAPVVSVADAGPGPADAVPVVPPADAVASADARPPPDAPVADAARPPDLAPPDLAVPDVPAGTPGMPAYFTVGGTVTSSDPGSGAEDMTRAFDRSVDTKWFAGGTAMPWIAYQLPGATIRVVTSYRVGAANDAPERDPASWVLEGSNDGAAWTPLDTRIGQGLGGRRMLNNYQVTRAAPYNRHRLRITANHGDLSTQLSELQLFGY
jgi:hypothetical protein